MHSNSNNTLFQQLVFFGTPCIAFQNAALFVYLKVLIPGAHCVHSQIFISEFYFAKLLKLSVKRTVQQLVKLDVKACRDMATSKRYIATSHQSMRRRLKIRCVINVVEFVSSSSRQVFRRETRLLVDKSILSTKAFFQSVGSSYIAQN